MYSYFFSGSRTVRIYAGSVSTDRPIDRSFFFKIKKKCDDSNRCSPVRPSWFSNSHQSVRASHRDDATRRDATRVVRLSRKNSRRKNLFVSLRVSSRSILRRAWRHSHSEIHAQRARHDAVDVANMPRCGHGSGDDDEDATRRCDDGDDATAGWWNGIFFRRTRGGDDDVGRDRRRGRRRRGVVDDDARDSFFQI